MLVISMSAARGFLQQREPLALEVFQFPKSSAHPISCDGQTSYSKATKASYVSPSNPFDAGKSPCHTLYFTLSLSHWWLVRQCFRCCSFGFGFWALFFIYLSPSRLLTFIIRQKYYFKSGLSFITHASVVCALLSSLLWKHCWCCCFLPVVNKG